MLNAKSDVVCEILRIVTVATGSSQPLRCPRQRAPIHTSRAGQRTDGAQSLPPFGATGNFSSNAAVVSVTTSAITTLLSFTSSSNFARIAK